MNEQDYLIAWGAYAIAGLGLMLVFWLMTGWMWRWLREPLRLIVFILLFTPTPVDPQNDLYAPAIAITALDVVFKVGNNAYYRNILMTIPDPSEMAVVINVHEADISKLKVGTPATIRSETNKGKTYQGVVDKIAKVANAGNRRWGDQIRRFRVEVKIQGSELDLKPGTSASVEVNIGELKDVVHVPLQAVHPKEGRFTAFVETPSGPEEKLVKVGRSNDAFLEITEGLKAGDKVLLYSPEPGSVKGDPAAGKAESGGSDKGSMRGKSRGKPSGSGPGRPGGRGRPQT